MQAIGNRELRFFVTLRGGCRDGLGWIVADRTPWNVQALYEAINNLDHLMWLVSEIMGRDEIDEYFDQWRIDNPNKLLTVDVVRHHCPWDTVSDKLRALLDAAHEALDNAGIPMDWY